MTLNNRIYGILTRNEEVDNDILATIITQEVLNSVMAVPLTCPPNHVNYYELGYKVGASSQKQHIFAQLLAGGD